MKKKNKPKVKNLGVRVPLDIFRAIDKMVDGVKYRSRAHVVLIILKEWIDKNER